jgi:hypothetical protein
MPKLVVVESRSLDTGCGLELSFKSFGQRSTWLKLHKKKCVACNTQTITHHSIDNFGSIRTFGQRDTMVQERLTTFRNETHQIN